MGMTGNHVSWMPSAAAEQYSHGMGVAVGKGLFLTSWACAELRSVCGTTPSPPPPLPLSSSQRHTLGTQMHTPFPHHHLCVVLWMYPPKSQQLPASPQVTSCCSVVQADTGGRGAHQSPWGQLVHLGAVFPGILEHCELVIWSPLNN